MFFFCCQDPQELREIMVFLEAPLKFQDHQDQLEQREIVDLQAVPVSQHCVIQSKTLNIWDSGIG